MERPDLGFNGPKPCEENRLFGPNWPINTNSGNMDTKRRKVKHRKRVKRPWKSPKETPRDVLGDISRLLVKFRVRETATEPVYGGQHMEICSAVLRCQPAAQPSEFDPRQGNQEKGAAIFRCARETELWGSL
ncbi:hypothetical protein QQP08_013250 [Theobroma cacao]|nr:hypothetical protein QQP08_013250 [Theobroma cacao]